MRTDEAFVAHLRELLDPLGRVAARAMFGGWGLYLDGLIIGIVDEGRFYLKADAASERWFAAAGSSPFVYMSAKGPMAMSYWSVPEEALDATERMAPWARLALEASLRKQAAKPAKRATQRPSKPPKRTTQRPSKPTKRAVKHSSTLATAREPPRAGKGDGNPASAGGARKTIADAMAKKSERQADRRKDR